MPQLTIKEAREFYYYYSGKASDIARQLAFAGLALIWIFRSGPDSDPKIPDSLIQPAVLIMLTLALDLLQYVSGTIL